MSRGRLRGGKCDTGDHRCGSAQALGDDRGDRRAGEGPRGRPLRDRFGRLPGHPRTDTVNRLHALLLDLVAGGANKHLTAPQARTILASVRPRDVVGRTRRQLAAELITELAVIDKKIKLADQALNELIAATGS